MIDARFTIKNDTAEREVSLGTYLDAIDDERAVASAHAWIKSLRHARVDGLPLRQRFRFRDDSLWWFAELYLHKQQVILNVFRTLAALEALFERERPRTLQFVRGGHIVRCLAPQLAMARGVEYRGPKGVGRFKAARLAAMDTRAVVLHAAALASRLRRRVTPLRERPPTVAAFVHRAFWQSEAGHEQAESYIGPVLTALETRLHKDAVAYVGIGPTANFRARRWWHPLRGLTSRAVAIEAYAPLDTLRPSSRVWHERHQMRRALWNSADLRQRSLIGRCDCWPVIQEELAGIALLQWPWSARAMDEAAAALETLQPRLAVTYAEAGGWGRALMLECRRRQIPSIGLQHGFIYRHWLNYLHESDEMAADPDNELDRGFPLPTMTLLFDDYAAQHLVTNGRYPSQALRITGSPRLDALAGEASRLTQLEIDHARTMAGADSRILVLVTTKHREARGVLSTFLAAAKNLPDVQVAIKAHPAETPAVYEDLVARYPNVTVLPASAPLAALLRASRAVVTVNSTVALDAAVLGVPALVIGLPNNLSPFVEAGIMMGVAGTDAAETARALDQLLNDDECRRRLALAQRTFLSRFGITADGRAAERAAELIVGLAR